MRAVNGLAVGDRVKYSVRWLRSTASFTGWRPFARGRVVALEPVGDMTLAVVAWDGFRVPGRVNVRNLVAERRLEDDDALAHVARLL